MPAASDPIVAKLPPLTVGWPHDPAAPLPAPGTSPVFASVQGAKAAGAVEGTVLAAPLAPASGPITGAPESLVVVTVKKFWDSPTIKAARTAVITAIGLAIGVIALQVISANGDLTTINWQTTEKAAIAAGAFSLATGYMAWWKTRDNNATK